MSEESHFYHPSLQLFHIDRIDYKPRFKFPREFHLRICEHGHSRSFPYLLSVILRARVRERRQVGLKENTGVKQIAPFAVSARLMLTGRLSYPAVIPERINVAWSDAKFSLLIVAAFVTAAMSFCSGISSRVTNCFKLPLLVAGKLFGNCESNCVLLTCVKGRVCVEGQCAIIYATSSPSA